VPKEIFVVEHIDCWAGCQVKSIGTFWFLPCCDCQCRIHKTQNSILGPHPHSVCCDSLWWLALLITSSYNPFLVLLPAITNATPSCSLYSCVSLIAIVSWIIFEIQKLGVCCITLFGYLSSPCR